MPGPDNWRAGEAVLVGAMALAMMRCSDADPGRSAHDRTEIALAALESGDRYDRQMALVVLAEEPPRMERHVQEAGRLLAALLADPGALVDHRKRAAVLLASRRDYAVHAVDAARAVLGAPGYRTAALDVLREAGAASRRHAAPVLAILRDDTAASADRALALDVLDGAALADETFRAILGQLVRDEERPALRAAARAALTRANARVAPREHDLKR